MFVLEVENKHGQKLKLSQNENNYQVLSIDGLTAPPATIHTMTSANAHGATYKTSKIESRNIVIKIKLRGNIEENRLRLYEYFSSSEWCKLYFRNKSRNVAIEGYVENTEANLFENNQVMQISILCPEPFFKDVDISSIDISKEHSAFEFPFAIDKNGIDFSVFERDRFTCVVNYGEADTGMVIEIELPGISSGNSFPCPVIRNYITGESLKINSMLNGGEKIIINTNVGKKSIVKISNGKETNIINTFNLKTTWLQLRKGANYFTYDFNGWDHLFKIKINYSSNYSGV